MERSSIESGQGVDQLLNFQLPPKLFENKLNCVRCDVFRSTTHIFIVDTNIIQSLNIKPIISIFYFVTIRPIISSLPGTITPPRRCHPFFSPDVQNSYTATSTQRPIKVHRTPTRICFIIRRCYPGGIFSGLAIRTAGGRVDPIRF